MIEGAVWTDGGLSIILEGRREDWPGGGRSLFMLPLPRYFTH